MFRLYEFVCENPKCTQKDPFEMLIDQEVKDGELVKCEHCKKKTARRILSVTPKHGSWTALNGL